MVVRLGADYPVVSGVLATVAGRRVFVPAEVVREIGHGYVELSEVRLDLRPFERRPEEVLLKQDVLDRQLINVEGARLVRTNEIELARVDGWYRVVGVDTGLRGLTRRVLPRRLAPRVQLGQFLDWASVEPFTGHVPTVRLRVPHPKLARLHPAQLADLVEAASHREGEEIMSALADEELEADVFEELDPQHQREFIVERTDAEVAGVLGAHGVRRRRGHAGRAGRGAAPADPGAAAAAAGPAGARAGRIRPGHRRRADEPGLHLPVRDRHQAGGGGADPSVTT